MATVTESLKGVLSISTEKWAAGLRGARVMFSAFASATAKGFERVGGGLLKIGGLLTSAIGGFLKLGKTIAGIGIAGLAAGITATVAGFKQISDLGGELSDVSARTGIAVGDLVILREQFRLAGLDITRVTDSVARLNRALEDDKKTDFFRSIGLDPASIQKLGNMEKLNRVLDAIRNKSNGNANAARQMMDEIFGRRQGAEMITLLDPAGFSKAKEMVGEMAGLMEKNANALDDVSDRFFNGFKTKWLQFWAGAIDPVLPQLERVTNWFAKLDFSATGKALAEQFQWSFNVLRDLFQEGKLGDFLFSSLLSGVVGIFSIAMNLAKQVGSAIFSKSTLNYLSLLFDAFTAKLGALINDLKSEMSFNPVTRVLAKEKSRALHEDADGMISNVGRAAPEFIKPVALDIASAIGEAMRGQGLESLKPFLESESARRQGLISSTATGRSGFNTDVAPHAGLMDMLRMANGPVADTRGDRSASAYMATEIARSQREAASEARYRRDNRLEAQARDFSEVTELLKQVAENTKMETQ